MSPGARWARLAGQVPGGFAGMYVESSPASQAPKQLVVLLVEPERWPEAREALRAYIESAYRSPEAPFPYSVETAKVRRARWNFAELYSANVYLKKQLPSGDLGVVSWDVDEKGNRLAYGVPSEAARRTVSARLSELRVPDGLVTLSIERPACFSDMVSAVRVWVHDAATQAPLNAGTWLIVRSGAFADSVLGTRNDQPLEAGPERSGALEVITRRHGYLDWTKLDVRVVSDACNHPKTVQLTAELQRR